MKEYDHKKIEKKWQTIWEKKGIYHANNNSKKKKYYSLIEFPYPSGDGLHVGHPRPYIGMDVISRKRRLEGFNVLYPIGWDAFGLPTENYAIKTGQDPRVVTKKNTDNFRRQIKSLGISFDWSREINTTDPKYYKWTQWIFLQFLKKGLAYKAKQVINWCPKDKTGLANEEVINGCCERCGTTVEKREKEQWMLAITKYADRLDKDLDTVDYLPQIKLGQRNWIGRSEGAEIEFGIRIAEQALKNSPALPASRLRHGSNFSVSVPQTIKIFTTRADTIFGAFAVILAPEHELVQKLKLQIKNWNEVEKYIEEIKNKTDIERTAEDKDKTGVELKGIKAINPVNGEEIPIWIADFILVQYGTGAVFADMHDERDFAFAEKYGLLMKSVLEPVFMDKPREDLLFVEREAIHAIVKHWKEDKYLVLKWKKVDWLTFVTGGVEKGEDPKEAAIREIREETGYQNVKLIKELPRSHSKFYHVLKKENRFAHFSNFYFQLIDGEQKELAQEEKEIHELRWMTMPELKKNMTIGGSLRDLKMIQGKEDVYTGYGILINSGQFNGLDSETAIKEITKFVGGKMVTKFKLRDWVFSRQRYWGEPIPVIHCLDCGIVPVLEKDLPVELPKVKNYQPTDSGESPLANITKWVNVKCPKCKGPGKRETDTMPNWAGSSWYYLRYTDAKNKKEFASKKNLKYWLTSPLPSPERRGGNAGGVDWYNGGNEHTTLHLLYSRFWHKFLFDLKLVPTNEPYKKRTSHGMILGEGGVKMSKSLGNVINPDDIVKTYGADTLRIYEMFMGPFDQSVAWSTESIIGPRRFLERVWNLAHQIQKNLPALPASGLRHGSNFSVSDALINKTIKKVTEDIEEMKFNTAISTLMIFTNEMGKLEYISKEVYEKFLKILSPFAPHITEELWQILGHKKSINLELWPTFDLSKIQNEEIKIVVQINGKVRTEMMIKVEDTEEEIKKKALNDENILKHLVDKNIKKVIYVKNRLINIVV